MKELYPLHGIVTVLNTPFTTVNKIDLNALEKNVSEALDAGVAGFLIPGMASEVSKLSEAERLSEVNTVLETVEGKVPVIAGAGESDPEMIMLQDWDAKGYGLPDELICGLFEKVEAFRCLKIETVPAGIKYSRILELTNGQLNVSGGWAVSQMIEGLKRGVHAFMPTAMHWIYVKIYRHFRNGEQDKAEELFQQIIPVLAFSNQHLDISIHFFKRLLFRQRIYPTNLVRKPILPFDQIHCEIADKLINKIIEIEYAIRNKNSNPIQNQINYDKQDF